MGKEEGRELRGAGFVFEKPRIRLQILDGRAAAFILLDLVRQDGLKIISRGCPYGPPIFEQ
ncbi:MAG TPA: hypothetical protein PK360_19830 [bacterium]|nr:hypothetical protein [bacterium]